MNQLCAETDELCENRLRHVQIFEEQERCGKPSIVSGVWIVRR